MFVALGTAQSRMQKPMNAQLSTTLGLGLLVISTVGTPGLEPSSKYFEIEFVNLWWNRLVGFRLKPKFGSVSGDCCSVISSRATLWLISCHMLDTGTRGCWMDFDETRFNVVGNGEDLTFCRVIYRLNKMADMMSNKLLGPDNCSTPNHATTSHCSNQSVWSSSIWNHFSLQVRKKIRYHINRLALDCGHHGL